MKVMFLDESGNHNLKKINSVYPIFVLAGVIVDRAYDRTVIDPRMREFKRRFLGTEDIVLHTVDMVRGRYGFESMQNPAFREEFYESLNAMLDELDYKIIACAIKLDEYVARYGANAPDPYMDSLNVLVERFCMDLEDETDAGFICAEMRNPHLDRALRRAWDDICEWGTGSLGPSEIDEKIVHLTLKNKKPNVAGMQLADLVATAVGRSVIAKPAHGNEVSRDVVMRKIRRVSGVYEGHGLVVRP